VSGVQDCNWRLNNANILNEITLYHYALLGTFVKVTFYDVFSVRKGLKEAVFCFSILPLNVMFG
jgi:hypothetical protein